MDEFMLRALRAATHPDDHNPNGYRHLMIRVLEEKIAAKQTLFATPASPPPSVTARSPASATSPTARPVKRAEEEGPDRDRRDQTVALRARDQ